MVDKESRRSRRAKRREEQDAREEATGDVESDEAQDAEADAGESDEAEVAEESADDAEAAGASGEEAGDKDVAAASERDEEEEEERPRRPRPAVKKKKKKKRAGSPDRIRDRNERIRERAAARRRDKREAQQGLAAGEMVDDALARWTQNATNWVKDHFNIVQWVVVALIASGIAWEIYSWRHTKQVEKASDKLIAAVEDEAAKLPGDEVSGPEADFDPRKTFPSAKARSEAAEKSYRAAASVAKGSGTSILATLGLAGVEYDQGKFGAAQKDYESVKGSALAKHDTDVKGRALEGVGMCLEAQKKLDPADKAYRELENMEVPGLTSLALYHQARVAFLKGDKDKAKKLLKKVQKKLDDSDSPYPPNSYLSAMSTQLMQTINPSAVPSRAGAPGMQLTPQQIEKLKNQIKKDPTKLKELMQKMGLKLPSAPKGAPAPTQAPPPEPAETSTAASGHEPAPAPEKQPAPKAPAPGKKAPAPAKTAPKAPPTKPAPANTPAPAGSAP